MKLEKAEALRGEWDEYGQPRQPRPTILNYEEPVNPGQAVCGGAGDSLAPRLWLSETRITSASLRIVAAPIAPCHSSEYRHTPVKALVWQAALRACEHRSCGDLRCGRGGAAV